MVLQLNYFPNSNLYRYNEEHVGSATTLRVTNAAWEGYRERETSGEAVIAAKWCARGPPCPRDALRRLGRSAPHSLPGGRLVFPGPYWLVIKPL
jgi:hypothetical protein